MTFGTLSLSALIDWAYLVVIDDLVAWAFSEWRGGELWLPRFTLDNTAYIGIKEIMGNVH